MTKVLWLRGKVRQSGTDICMRKANSYSIHAGLDLRIPHLPVA